MSIFGIFENRNRDLNEFVNESGALTIGGTAHVNKRRMYAEQTQKDGVKYYKYHLVVPINHGLARQDKPLPAGRFNFLYSFTVFFSRDPYTTHV